MNADFNVEVELLDNSEEVIQLIEDKIPPALEAVGIHAERRAKEICPVDTGRLRNSIAYAVVENDVYIGTNVEYAPYVEMGTSRMKPQPFLKPAAENYTDEYSQIIKRYMRDDT